MEMKDELLIYLSYSTWQLWKHENKAGEVVYSLESTSFKAWISFFVLLIWHALESCLPIKLLWVYRKLNGIRAQITCLLQVDPNTGASMYESDDIIKYLVGKYGVYGNLLWLQVFSFCWLFPSFDDYIYIICWEGSICMVSFGCFLFDFIWLRICIFLRYHVGAIRT